MTLDIVVASGKGGVGKSLMTSSLAYLLRDRFRIVALDADAPAPNLHIIFGVNEWEHVEDYFDGTIAEISVDKCVKCNICVGSCIYDAIVPSDGSTYPVIRGYLCEGCRACGYSCPKKAISYVPVKSGVLRRTKTKYGFPLISAKLDVGRPNSGKLVTDERKWAREIGSEDSITLIDAAAGIGCELIASMSGAHISIFVVEPTEASLRDMMRAYSVAEHFGLTSYLVVNKSTLNPDFAAIKRFAEEKRMEILGQIPYDEAIPKSLHKRMPLIEIYPESEAANAIKDIASKVAGIIEARMKE